MRSVQVPTVQKEYSANRPRRLGAENGVGPFLGVGELDG